jgi:hypothetical protein
MTQAIIALGAMSAGTRLEAETPTVTTHAERMGPGTVVVRLPAAVTLHGVRVELFAANGSRLPRATGWQVKVLHGARVQSGAAEPMAQLSDSDPVMRLPRPFGVSLEAGDSLLVVATIPGDDAARGVLLQVTLEYDGQGRPINRVPVLALSAFKDAASEDGIWILRPSVAGRLVAISGRLLTCADEIVLEDVTTGRVVWRTRLGAAAGVDADQRGEVVRPGVTVEAGRTYALRTTRNTRAECAGATPQAMLLPR